MITTKQTKVKLGLALAYVRNVLNVDGNELEGLSTQERSFISAVHHRFVQLASEQNSVVFSNIPSCACHNGDVHLANNIDFFISFLLIGFDEENESVHTQLVKHLNDCYWCFEWFTEVVRDYFHASQRFNN